MTDPTAPIPALDKLKRPPTTSVKEAAKILDCSEALLYKLAKHNRMPVLRVGESVKIPVAWIEERLKEATVTP